MNKDKSKIYILNVNNIILGIIEELIYKHQPFDLVKLVIQNELFKKIDLIIHGELLVTRDVKTLKYKNEGINLIKSVFTNIETIIDKFILTNYKTDKYYSFITAISNGEIDFLFHSCRDTIAYYSLLEQIYITIGEDCMYDVWDIINKNGIYYLKYEGTFQELEYYRLTGQKPWN